MRKVLQYGTLSLNGGVIHGSRRIITRENNLIVRLEEMMMMMIISAEIVGVWSPGRLNLSGDVETSAGSIFVRVAWEGTAQAAGPSLPQCVCMFIMRW